MLRLSKMQSQYCFPSQRECVNTLMWWLNILSRVWMHNGTQLTYSEKASTCAQTSKQRSQRCSFGPTGVRQSVWRFREYLLFVALSITHAPESPPGPKLFFTIQLSESETRPGSLIMPCSRLLISNGLQSMPEGYRLICQRESASA